MFVTIYDNDENNNDKERDDDTKGKLEMGGKTQVVKVI